MVGAVELTSLAEYLRTSYEPDCEFVSGRLHDRHIGEISHSEVQTSCAVYLRIRYPHLWTGVATRVRVAEDRIRVPDVMVLPPHAKVDRIVTTPPLVVIEVLSSEDRANDLLEKIVDYLQFGIDSVWILDPKTGQAYNVRKQV
jgi:Uma2 family endonuclease